MSEYERFRMQFGDRWCLDLREDEPLPQVCTLPPDHDGDHEGRHVETGELFAAWPRA